MRLVWVVIPLILIVSMIVVVGVQESFATEPCFLSPQAHWNSYDDIYTGKVVSITNQTTDARIDFELEHLLKGNPPLTWNKNVPFETFRGVGIPGFGTDHFTVGSEIFYIENYNHNGPSNSGGYCGIGVSKVSQPIFQLFFEYYEELYGKPVPKYIENNNLELFAEENYSDGVQYIIETHFYPSEWSDAVQITVHEYVNDVIIQNKTILHDSIKIRISGGMEDVLPPRYSVRILYDIIDDKKIYHMDSIYDVNFGPLVRTPENTSLVKTSEMEYKSPKKITFGYDLEDEQIANIVYHKVMCRQGFEKIMKETTGDTVCVKPSTAEKLIQRGWTS